MTVYSKPCIFPFTYQGTTYYTCTTAGSENGAAWCAVQVNIAWLTSILLTLYRLIKTEQLFKMLGRIVMQDVPEAEYKRCSTEYFRSDSSFVSNL